MLTDRQRRSIEAMRRDGRAAGNLDDYEEVASMLPTRRNDPVGEWPAEKLGELLAARPDLEGEIRRRRPSEVVQL